MMKEGSSIFRREEEEKVMRREVYGQEKKRAYGKKYAHRGKKIDQS
ncbi:MAG: hypothetical protein ROO73_03590 [Roseivirga sp.]